METRRKLPPTWDEMSELDRGIAATHVWRRGDVGVRAAVRECPAVFVDDPVLSRMDPDAACQFAFEVTGGGREPLAVRIGGFEVDRLMRLAEVQVAASMERMLLDNEWPWETERREVGAAF